ncbi:MAG: peptidylprolyl isomerase [Dehalococcoidia bacterium]|nr:peptidylprolyl isomerase [Dehalococcoidia bacterium]
MARNWLLLTLLLLSPLLLLACGIVPTPTPTSVPEFTLTVQYKEAFPMTIDATKQYVATLRTDKGDIVIELNAKKAPITVNNFVNLAQRGYYNNTTFHRVLPDFMAQGGDPTGSGSGGPGYTIADEFTDLTHELGVISMANTGQPHTGGSQFFITYVPTPHLNGKHTVFGKVTKGMDVVKALNPRDPSRNPGFPGSKLIEVTIQELAK